MFANGYFSNVSLVHCIFLFNFDQLVDIDRPLLVYGGKKFHMRVHVVASGTLQVYVHQDIIALISSEPYVREDIGNKVMRIPFFLFRYRPSL